MSLSALASIPKALVRPDAVFPRREVYRAPKILIALAVFLIYVTGLRLAAGINQNPHAKELAAAEVMNQMSSFMANMSPEEQRMVKDRALSQIMGDQGGITTAVSLVFSALFFLALIIEMWLLCAIITQFFGGQEERRGKERPSLSLFLTAFIPLAVRKLLQGVILSFRNPDVAANALTLKEYNSLLAVKFDFFSLLPDLGLPPFFAILLKLATDPFLLWTLAVIAVGSRDVYRISTKSAFGQSAVLLLILVLQYTLLARIGIPTEL